jgi:hypothetical protein
MKVLVFVKATPNSETKGMQPTPELLQAFADMGKFNEQLVKAGIVQDMDGLKPSKEGKRVTFSAGQVSVTDGPFVETKELVAGYWVWNVKSMEEAMEWARRCPNPMPGEEGVLEIRPTFQPEDLAEFMTEEHGARAKKFRKQVESRQKAKAAPKKKKKAKAKKAKSKK